MKIDDIKKIILLSFKEKINLLKDIKFREKLFLEENHYPFVWLVQGLDKDLLYLLDDDIIDLLEKDKRVVDKLNAIIDCGNSLMNTFLSNNRIIKLIVDNVGDLGFLFRNINLAAATKIFEYLIENNLSISVISRFSPDVQLELIKSNIDLIKKENIPLGDIFTLSGNVLDYLIKDNYYYSKLKGHDNYYISILINKGLTLPISLQTDKDVINGYLKGKNINEFYRFINTLGNNYYLKEELLKERRKQYLKEISTIDMDKGIFNKYLSLLDSKREFEDYSYISFCMNNDLEDSYETKLKYFQNMTVTRMLEMTVDTFFQDLTYNFLKNIDSILYYIETYKRDIIPEERIKIYKKFQNYYDISMRDRIELFNELNNNSRNNIEDFYDDYKAVKNESNERIKDSLTDITKLNKISKESPIDIYELNGEEFKLLITVTNKPKYNCQKDSKIWFESKTRPNTSCSIISDENINLYGDPYSNVILGFYNYDIRNIIITHPDDAYTSEVDGGSTRVQKFYFPDELIDRTKSYNEIQISEKYGMLKPDFVVCYDKITDGDINAAISLGNIPIILIHTDKYKMKNDFYEFTEEKYKKPDEISDSINYNKR